MRELIRYTGLLILVLGNYSCDPAISEDDLVEEEVLLETVKTVGGKDGNQTYFTIELPSEMKQMDELHETALVKYASLSENQLADGNSVFFEHYVIVLMEKKEAIIAKHAEIDLDLATYFETVGENFKLTYEDQFKWLNNDLIVEYANDLAFIQGDALINFDGEGNEVSAYYKIAVFEGEYAYYQIITWCVDGQQNKFESKMDHLISSFKEVALNEI